MIDALQKSRGLVSVAAKLIGCSRQAINQRMVTHPEIKDAVYDATELQLDMTETALFAAIQRGEAWAICFYLKTRGRQRGYIEKVDHNHAGNVGHTHTGLSIQDVMAQLEQSDEFCDVARNIRPAGDAALPSPARVVGAVQVSPASGGNRSSSNGRHAGPGPEDHHG